MNKNSKDLGFIALCTFVGGLIVQFFIIYLGPEFTYVDLSGYAMFPKLRNFTDILNGTQIVLYSSYLWINFFYYIIFLVVFCLICLIYTRKSLSRSNFAQNYSNPNLKNGGFLIVGMLAFGLFNLRYLLYRATWGRRFLSVDSFDNFTSYANSHIIVNFISSSAFILIPIVGFLALFLRDWRKDVKKNA
jgi:hypothetical protein